MMKILPISVDDYHNQVMAKLESIEKQANEISLEAIRIEALALRARQRLFNEPESLDDGTLPTTSATDLAAHVARLDRMLARYDTLVMIAYTGKV